MQSGEPSSHRFFPLPLFQLPPSVCRRLISSRRIQQRDEFNLLVLQLSNIALTALNIMAAGLDNDAADHFLHWLNATLYANNRAYAAPVHSAPPSAPTVPERAEPVSNTHRTPPSAAPLSQPASFPFAILCRDGHTATIPCRLLPSAGVGTRLPLQQPSPAQLRSVEQLYLTVRRFARLCRASTIEQRSGVATLRLLCAVVYTAAQRRHHTPAVPRRYHASTLHADILPPTGDPHAGAGLPNFHPYAAPMPVVPIVAARIALPDKLQSVPICTLLPPDTAATYADPRLLLRDPLSVAALDAAEPLPPPRVSGERIEYVRLIARMRSVGMACFIAEPKAVNGVFAVNKDDASDRLIIDAQPANRLFVDSPHVRLPNPSHLVQLFAAFGTCLFLAKSDLSNFYHQLLLPEAWRPYFALPPLTPAECAELGIDPAAAYPACTTLPMGFSHAVVIAQAVHEFVLYHSGELQHCNNLLNLTTPLVGRCLHMVYIDDLIMLGTDYDSVVRDFNSALAAYARCGLPDSAKKREPPRRPPRPIKGIGIVMDGSALTLSIAVEDRLALVQRTLGLLYAPTVTGRQLGQLIGSWVWCLMLRRPALALLFHSYRFIAVADRRQFTLWPAVRHELLCLLCLTPLLQTDIAASFHHHAYATDASELAAGVVATPLTAELVTALYPLSHSPQYNLLPLQRWHADRRRGAQAPAMPAELLQHYATDDGTALLRSIGSHHWATLIASPWRYHQHINALELHAVLLALRHVLSIPHATATRVFTLVDSAVAYYTLWKGRSSSPLLLSVLRQINSLLLASGCSLQPCWIPSEWNPADAPSRLRLPASHSSSPPFTAVAMPASSASPVLSALSDADSDWSNESLLTP